MSEHPDQETLLPFHAFLSYAREDRTHAERLTAELRTAGVRAWLDLDNLHPGAEWEFEIARAIESCPYLLVLFSSLSIGKRGYVQKEMREVLRIADLLPPGQTCVIPIRLDDCPIPEQLEKWNVIDGRNPIETSRLVQFLQDKLGIHPYSAAADHDHRTLSTLDPSLVCDAQLLRVFARGTVRMRTSSRDSDLLICNGYFLEVRKRTLKFINLFDQTFPRAERVPIHDLTRLIPSPDEYRSEGHRVVSISLTDPSSLVLIAADGSRAGADPDYFNYVLLKYKLSPVYLAGSNRIIVEENSTVRFLLMARHLVYR